MARNWAITIGINGYRYLQRLNYALRDADAVHQFFSQELDFHQVYHFTDESPPIPQDYGPDLDSQPTSTTLGRFLRTRFEQPFLRDGDNLWFFFAGHGIRHDNRDYLMPLDGDRDDLERSAIPIHYISERLRRSGADNVIMLIDACRSDEGRRDGLGIGTEKQQGVITLFSCSPEESSYEIQELQQGVFTHVLLESLQLQGEGNCATVERLYQRLRYYVPQLTREYKRVSQTPYGVIEPPSKNHLILLPRQATLADIETLKKDALTAEVQGNLKVAKQFWVRVLAVSPADPEAIEGIERLSRGGSTSQPATPNSQKQPVPASASGTSRAATPVSPSKSPPPQKTVVQLSASAPKPPTRALPPQPFLPRTSTRTVSSASLADRISRRRAIQILGFTGGGVGTILLGKGLLTATSPSPEPSPSPSSEPSPSPSPEPSSEWKLPDLEPATTNGAIAEFNVATVNIENKSIAVERKQAEFRTQELGNGITLDLMLIPGGNFTMGSPQGEGYDAEKPQHGVTLQPFLMGKYPVTQAQWKAVVALPKVERDLDADPSNFKGDSLPVEAIDWDDAVEFCQRLSMHTKREYRLPSEAEWEYACRAGTTTPFYFGETITTGLANYRGTDWEYEGETYPGYYGEGPRGEYREQTTDVGSFPANAFGLYDMHGNVWEWCLDHWHENYEGAPTDGSAWIVDGDSSRRLLRGGSWFNDPADCRSANRSRDARGSRNGNVGFRVVCVSSWAL